MTTPMMQCGHAANATYDGDKPCCAICIGLEPGAKIVAANPPDLTGRFAECAYGHHGQVASSSELAFFKHEPDKETDRYYCGCRGWS
jgi:hypothetical protein